MRHAAKTPVMRDGKAGRRMGMDDLAVEAHVKLCSDERPHSRANFLGIAALR